MGKRCNKCVSFVSIIIEHNLFSSVSIVITFLFVILIKLCLELLSREHGRISLLFKKNNKGGLRFHGNKILLCYHWLE